MLEAQNILKTNLRVAKRYISFLNHDNDSDFVRNLGIYMHQIEDFRASLDEVLETSKAAARTVSSGKTRIAA